MTRCTKLVPDTGSGAEGRDLGYLSLGFPETPGWQCAAGEPGAFLSLAALGDMRYSSGGEASAALANRLAFFDLLGLDPDLGLGVELKHSRRLMLMEEGGRLRYGDSGEEGDCDGILLHSVEGDGRDGRFAGVTVADCMPIWILDRASGAFGVLHSGWKGTGILRVAVQALRSRYSSPPEALAVILGPSIGPCCYAVPEERAEAFAAEFGPEAAPRLGGSPRLDLRAANIGLATSLGVGALLSVEACTACDEAFGSYRRQGSTAYTRMLALCARPRGREVGT